jgi:hypothetical protein
MQLLNYCGIWITEVYLLLRKETDTWLHSCALPCARMLWFSGVQGSRPLEDRRGTAGFPTPSCVPRAPLAPSWTEFPFIPPSIPPSLLPFLPSSLLPALPPFLLFFGGTGAWTQGFLLLGRHPTICLLMTATLIRWHHPVSWAHGSLWWQSHGTLGERH